MFLRFSRSFFPLSVVLSLALFQVLWNCQCVRCELNKHCARLVSWFGCFGWPVYRLCNSMDCTALIRVAIAVADLRQNLGVWKCRDEPNHLCVYVFSRQCTRRCECSHYVILLKNKWDDFIWGNGICHKPPPPPSSPPSPGVITTANALLSPNAMRFSVY